MACNVRGLAPTGDLGNRDEAVSLRAQVVDDPRQSDGRSVDASLGIEMQLDDGSVECTIDGVAVNGFGGRTRVPVPGTYAPSDRNKTLRTGDRSNSVIARTRIRRKPGSGTVSQC